MRTIVSRALLAGLAAGLASAQIQVPHGPVPTPVQAPRSAALQAAPMPPAANQAQHAALQLAPPQQSQYTDVPHQQQQVSAGDGGSRRSENYFLTPAAYDALSPYAATATTYYGGGAQALVAAGPSFHVAAGYPGFYAGYGVSPQQNGDGSWNFVALPLPLENQTIPDGFPKDKVAQAKLWGPIYKEGKGWVYGEAGTILVPKYPPYAPPPYVTPPALRSSSSSGSSSSSSSSSGNNSRNRDNNDDDDDNNSNDDDDDDKAPYALGTTSVDRKTGRAVATSSGRRAPSKGAGAASARSTKRIERLRQKPPRK